MRLVRSLIAAAVVACVTGAVPGLAQAATTPSTAQLTDYACQRTVDPAFRAMTVTAYMRPVTGTQAMRMQFVLLESHALHGHYHVVHGHNLGHWLVPDPTNLGQRPGDTWKVIHPVALLSAPAFYRLKVTFRWLGTGAKRLAQVAQVTPTCHQLELRPDLRVLGVTVTALLAKPTQDAYVATINNHGLTGAGPFDVTLTAPDGSTVTRTVAFLGHHKTRQIRFVATACSAGQTVTVAADPAGSVLDYDRSNNTLTVPCPATTAG